MARFVTGTTFGTTELVTAAKLNTAVNDAKISTDSVDNSTIEINSDALRIKDSGVTKAKIENVANMKVLGNTSGSATAPQEVAILDEDNMTSDSATSLATQQSIKAYVLAISNQYFHLQETEDSGTDSTTTLVGNAYTKRPVTSVSNNIASASVSSGTITLPAGTYEVKAFGLCKGDGFATSPNRTRFRNTSDSTTAILGASVQSIGQTNLDNQCHPLAYLQGTFTIAGSKNFELQHFKGGATNVVGGDAASSGENEVYADVLIKKLD